MNEQIKGHMLACMTILIWGTTFISTKVLLRDFTPLQILFTRFMIGYLALWAVAPRLTRVKEKKEELYFLAAGLCGVTLYFLMENIALTYTQAILCISLEGSQNLALNPKGDLLALGAAIVWALYSTITKKISSFGYTTIPMTRRIFFYGLLCMLPVIMLSGMELPKVEQLTGLNIANILFLGLGASAMCFVSWNSAVRILGTVQTSVYIYAVPVVTTLASVWILKETVTIVGVLGIVMIVLGLLLSQNRKGERVWRKTENASW